MDARGAARLRTRPHGAQMAPNRGSVSWSVTRGGLCGLIRLENAGNALDQLLLRPEGLEQLGLEPESSGATKRAG
jgi:hypothetical protein